MPCRSSFNYVETTGTRYRYTIASAMFCMFATDSYQVADALFLLLPGSVYYPVISTLPPPDATNPTATSTFQAQSAVHNSLPIYDEIISIIERHEEAVFNKEVANRRMRIGAAGPEQIKKEVGREIWRKSRVRTRVYFQSRPTCPDCIHVPAP